MEKPPVETGGGGLLRVKKVIAFWRKKKREKAINKHVHKRKAKVASKKLRIQGKFVTIEQAIALVGKRKTNALLKQKT
jgi:hypothetical protein